MAEKAKGKEKETRSLAPWRPFAELTRMEREMERMFENFLGQRMRPFWPGRRGLARAWRFPFLRWMFTRRKTTLW